MKYTMTVFDENEKEYTAQVAVRSTAHIETLLKKCTLTMIDCLRSEGVLSGRVKYVIEKPNIWTNGGFPAVFIYRDEENSFDMHISREDGLVLA